MKSKKLSELLKTYSEIEADPNGDPELTAVTRTVEATAKSIAADMAAASRRTSPQVTRPRVPGQDEQVIGLVFDLIAIGLGAGRLKTHKLLALEFCHPSKMNRYNQRVFVSFEWSDEVKPRALMIVWGRTGMTASSDSIKIPFSAVSEDAIGDAVSQAIKSLASEWE